jgi:hypothetical protein
VTVPKNAIVTVQAGPLDGTRLIDVEWDGHIIMMFTVDLRERGAQIESAQRECLNGKDPTLAPPPQRP